MPSRVADILMEQGRQAALAARQQGQISADMWNQLGQIPGQVIQQYQQQKKAKLQEDVTKQHLALGSEELKQFERKRQGQELAKSLYAQHTTIGDNGHLTYNDDAIVGGFRQAGFDDLADHHLDFSTKLQDHLATTQVHKLAYEASVQNTYANAYGSLLSVPEDKRAEAYPVWREALRAKGGKDPVFGSLPETYPGHDAFQAQYESHRTNAERLAEHKEKAEESRKNIQTVGYGQKIVSVDPVTQATTTLAEGEPDPFKGVFPVAPGGKLEKWNPATGKMETMAEGGPPPGAADKERHELETERLAREALSETRAFHREEAAARRASGAKDKLVRVEHMDDTTGRTVVEWLPQSELAGRTFKKGVGSTIESRIASAQAVNQTGQDMIAQLRNPAIASKLGPAMGRFNTLREFIGNPPPELAELAGSIESYALANMGVHGMRSAQGAEQIKTLLDRKHTPESLIATINGLNKFSAHFMENEGRGTTGAGPGTTPPSAVEEWTRDASGKLVKKAK